MAPFLSGNRYTDSVRLLAALRRLASPHRVVDRMVINTLAVNFAVTEMENYFDPDRDGHATIAAAIRAAISENPFVGYIYDWGTVRHEFSNDASDKADDLAESDESLEYVFS